MFLVGICSGMISAGSEEEGGRNSRARRADWLECPSPSADRLARRQETSPICSNPQTVGPNGATEVAS